MHHASASTSRVPVSFRHVSLAVVACFALTTSASATAVNVYTITAVGGSGSSNINRDAPKVWTFTAPQESLDVGGGLFSMKSGVNAQGNITFLLYRGTQTAAGYKSATGSLLASTTLTSSQFADQVGGSNQQFLNHAFTFASPPAPIQLTAGETYTAIFEAPGATNGSNDYKVEGSGISFLDASGKPFTPSAVPEPSTMALVGIGMGVAACSARRRRTAA